ncbi:family 10 glycosylhydrolase [Coleofasciculus sp. E1-EBD-02]|uniref:family 10 glycosylhydrolase n=1 Tax=Coleofasciculus sp. E1-EBD-02 TaxID=3068481 RepID=UPI0032F4D1AA
MSNGLVPIPRGWHWRYYYRSLVAALLTSSIITQGYVAKTAQAQTAAYCHFTDDAIAQKESLRQGAIKGNPDFNNRYKAIVKQHADVLRQCRDRTFPQDQAIWLRLYACDVRAGAIDEILDRIVNRGYNKVYVEVFSDGQVLLPASDNPTPWPPVVRTPGYERVDLLAQTIQKGHERGLRVYAWMFSMNFGYRYAQRSDRQDVLARNGRGQTSLSYVHDQSQAFIDPYNNQAKTDYYQLVQAVTKRRPDGVLFDYIRYPRGSGSDSVVTKVKDLWIYSDASRQALYNRALNNQGRELIQHYVQDGSISAGDVESVKTRYANESTPMWQGRSPSESDSAASINWQLWQLSVAHAAQGVLDFLSMATLPVQRAGIKAGAVFFPDGNQVVGRGGYDSRLQPWDHFSPSLEWHPMSYGVCGHTGCIESLVRRVVDKAPLNTKITPALAGTWGKSVSNRPSLEKQMQAIRQRIPNVSGISHFAFSWQDPQFDRDRKFCRLQ